MRSTTLVIQDEVNCKFVGLDPKTRRLLLSRLKFFVPYAYHTPTFKLGRWDGTVAFGTVGGATYINLLDLVLDLVIDNGYDIEIEDRRPKYDFSFDMVEPNSLSQFKWPDNHPRKPGEEIVLDDHQVISINRFFENPQSIQRIATGAGKTILTACLAMNAEKYGRTITVVPNKSLVEQTEEDFNLVGLDVGVYYGDRKEYDKTHTICTWQSLNVLEKKGKNDDDRTIEHFLTDVQCVICDECHSAKANVLHKLLTKHFAEVPIRWGLTGTIPKEDYDRYSLLSSIGEVIGEVSAKELQDKNILANCHIHIVQLLDTLEFKDWNQERKFLSDNMDRLEYISKFVDGLEGNALVLVNHISTGDKMLDLIEDSVFIRGKTKTSDRKKHYEEVHDTDNKVIIATYGVASVGINIPRIFHLVLVEPGKSFVRVIQSIGRGLRKAEDKDHIEVWDICSSTKYSKRHLTQRKKYYRESEYPFDMTKVDYKEEMRKF